MWHGVREVEEKWPVFALLDELSRFGGVKAGKCGLCFWRNGWIDTPQLKALAAPLAKSSYGEYLAQLAADGGVSDSSEGAR